MKITQQDIVTKAVAILNDKGLDALSMRTLASQLDVKAATLYFHVKNKEDLLTIISESVSEAVIEQLATNDKQTITTLIHCLRTQLLKIRDAARIFTITSPFTPHRLSLITRFLEMLRAENIPEARLTTAGNLINNYVLSFVQDEQLFSRATPDSDVPLQSPISKTNPDDDFDYGLAVILNGLQNVK